MKHKDQLFRILPQNPFILLQEVPAQFTHNSIQTLVFVLENICNVVNLFVFEVVLGARTLELPPCVQHCLVMDTISTTALHSVSTEFTQGCGPVCGNTGRLETWKALSFSKTNLPNSH